ncbi:MULTISPECIES: SDR family NAD(P)-dependent oxidoreductase [unclassified Haladaptatus]|uniref:SDR family NAD(P)-dependent oxidoreductase n=2 Tax=unclassified Haladaptatus TaxID=2622732 RepID=UPI0023E8F424|nr:MULTISPECIES: SDR family oxidoreductase [unclassified Haladaptatus]
MRLANKTAFITGAASGLGRAAAERFAAEGATVIAADVDESGVEELVHELDGEAVAHELDVRDSTAFEDAIDATAAEFGLDILLNNAGIMHHATPMEDLAHGELDRLIDVNVKGVWNGCAAALPHFKRQGSGAIVNTASLAGVIGSPKYAGYSLTKGAVVNVTRAIAAEVGPDGVRVNAVCPGVTETPMPKADHADDEWDEIASRMADAYPLRRLGQPEDVANAMLFLASDEASWITGEALVVDGGFSCA